MYLVIYTSTLTWFVDYKGACKLLPFQFYREFTFMEAFIWQYDTGSFVSICFVDRVYKKEIFFLFAVILFYKACDVSFIIPKQIGKPKLYFRVRYVKCNATGVWHKYYMTNYNVSSFPALYKLQYAVRAKNTFVSKY